MYIKFQIRIHDNGQGISPENLSKLFMNFAKLEEHAEKNKQGTGLGLSICKTLVELMGGTVTVESEVGVGAVFIMSLQTKCQVAEPKVVDDWKMRLKCKKDPRCMEEHLNTGRNNVTPN